MCLSFSERSKKLRRVANALGYDHPLNLLHRYLDKEIVPGICTNEICDCVTNVAAAEEIGHCPSCDTYTVASILVIAGII